jgi:hypothetical protein
MCYKKFIDPFLYKQTHLVNENATLKSFNAVLSNQIQELKTELNEKKPKSNNSNKN